MKSAYKVLASSDKRLRMVCEPISKKLLRQPQTQELIDTLLEYTFYHNNKGVNRIRIKPSTVGLSGNQIGIMKQISVVDLAISHKRFSELFVLINPEIIWRSKSILERTESCVNLKHIWGIVARSSRIKVKALDRSGNMLSLIHI